MSFQEPRSDISICNRALSTVRQQGLTGSLTDPANSNKYAAQQCVLWYKATVRMLLEKHHWGIATRRTALLATDNTLGGQWTAAFLAPTDMAFPVTVDPTSATTGLISYYRGLGALIGMLYGRPLFRYDNGTIFTMTDQVVLEYVSLNITESDFTQDFEDLVVLGLAARLARSVAKDLKLAEELDGKFLHAINLAIAHNLNQQGPRYGNTVSDGEMARIGIDSGLVGLEFYR